MRKKLRWLVAADRLAMVLANPVRKRELNADQAAALGVAPGHVTAASGRSRPSYPRASRYRVRAVVGTGS